MSKAWYFITAVTNREDSIERSIRHLLEKNELDPQIVTDVKVPSVETTEIVNGKKKTRREKLMPGFVMVEMDLPQTDWKQTVAAIRHVSGSYGFVGVQSNERPRPITSEEAKRIFQQCGELKGEKQVSIKQSYSVGDVVKITDGPFASFSGNIEEVNPEKETIRVNVQIFGRATPVEVNFVQVERV